MPASSTPNRPGRPGRLRRTPRRPAIAAGLLLLVASAVAVGLLLVRDEPHRYVLAVPSAGQLRDGDEVRVGGRRVGTIGDLRLAPDRSALIDLHVGGDVAPLHRGTTATLRAPSLSGAAERSVSLSPGPNNAPVLADGARIPADRVRQIADVDQLLAALDAPTRAGLRGLLRGASRTTAGRERLARATLRRLDPTLRSGQALLGQLVRDAPALQSFLDSSSRIVGALALQRRTLPGLVSHARAATADVVAEEAAVDATLDRLPGTLDRGRATLDALNRTIGTADPLVDAALPATARLAPLLRRLRPLARTAGPTVADTRALVRRRGGDDLTDLLGRTPALADAAVPALRNTASAATASRPVARFARPYTPDLVGWLRTVSQTTAGYDANGHYARIQPLFDRDAFAGDGVLSPAVRALAAALGPASDTDAQTVGARRCPGTATQIRPDGSNDPAKSDEPLDCDRGAVLPGP